jgi:hypothetical protein
METHVVTKPNRFRIQLLEERIAPAKFPGGSHIAVVSHSFNTTIDNSHNNGVIIMVSGGGKGGSHAAGPDILVNQNNFLSNDTFMPPHPPPPGSFTALGSGSGIGSLTGMG